MQHFSRRFAVYALAYALALGLQAVPAWAFATDGEIKTRVDALIGAFLHPLEAGTVTPPGLSLAVGVNGRLVHARGYGEERAGVPARPETRYKVGSITKHFTAAAVLNLIDRHAVAIDGKTAVTLDTPAAALLRGTDWAIEGGPPITVKNLLTMTSNLPNFTRRPPHNLDPWGAVPARKLLGEIAAMQPSGYPGSFEYSNTSYFLLSQIIEDVFVDGQSRRYEDIVQQDLFEPLHLQDTGVSGPSDVKPVAAPHYHRKPAFTEKDWLKGSGDIVSTAPDIFEWNRALMEGRILSPEARTAMLSDDARVDVWTYYGMGWFVTHAAKADKYFHSGTVPGYTSFNMSAGIRAIGFRLPF